MNENDRPRVGDVYQFTGTVMSVDDEIEVASLSVAGDPDIVVLTRALTPDKRIRRKEIEVGDRVKWYEPPYAEMVVVVLAIDGGKAWVKYHDDIRATVSLSALTPVPSDEAGGA